MITRKEYLKALDTVEAYHEQLNLQIVSSSNGGKTPLEHWLLQNRDKCSSRLIHIITDEEIQLQYRYGGRILEGGFKYIEDITEKIFLLQTNAGKKTWKEFVSVRGY